ncbi:DUF6223 family protein [Nocardia niwae]|uniref:DUF6223 family protein n=1 Tax=Nocardia niwae TaxID=626084 RepID=A0ABV2XCM5_9NOCA|nr:DUF6223 family protein [Nocardia niwae]
MSVRHLSAVAATALLGGITFAAPAAASVQQTAAVTGMTSGRLLPTLTALVGLVSVVFGSLALARTGAGSGRNLSVTALVAGLVGLILGCVFAATAAGGPGTGNGIVGSWAAMVLGLIGVVLGGLALNRSRKVDSIG